MIKKLADMKYCRICNCYHDRKYFGKNKQNKDGLMYSCRDAINSKAREEYPREPETKQLETITIARHNRTIKQLADEYYANLELYKDQIRKLEEANTILRDKISKYKRIFHEGKTGRLN